MSDEPAETYECETCGAYCEDTKRCQLCWSIEEHLATFIKSPAGRAFVIRTLRESDLGVPYVSELQHLWEQDQKRKTPA